MESDYGLVANVPFLLFQGSEASDFAYGCPLTPVQKVLKNLKGVFGASLVLTFTLGQICVTGVGDGSSLSKRLEIPRGPSTDLLPSVWIEWAFGVFLLFFFPSQSLKIRRLQ